VPGAHRPRCARGRRARPCARAPGPRRNPGRDLRRRRRGADRPQHRGSGRARPRGRLGLLRCRRRWVGHRHRQGRQPAHHPSRRVARLRDPAHRCRQVAVAAAQTAHRRPDDRRHRLGVDHDLCGRPARAPAEGRDQPSPAPPVARRGRPAHHAEPSLAGHRIERDGRALTRAGELYERPLRRQTGAGGSHAPAGVLRCEPGERRLVRDGAAARRHTPARGRPQWTRPRGAHGDGARVDLRGHRFRQRRDAPAARGFVPDRRCGRELPR
jgi:hypothetical protein